MKQATKIILSILALTAVFIWFSVAKSPTADVIDKNVHIFFFDVGQGDAELIEQGNFEILIDGGPDDKILSQIGEAMPVYDRKIEIVILSHPHADHLVGLNQLIDRYEIGKIYYSGVSYDSAAYKEFLSRIDQKNIPKEIPDIGKNIETFADAQLMFLWPGQKFSGQSEENLNNTSEVFKFCYFENCALFTGDIETDGQKEMFSNCHPEANAEESSEENATYRSRSFAYAQDDKGCGFLQSQILKLPHHGSQNGTDQALLDAISPEYVVIEVGTDNRYGHPHAPVLDLLKKIILNFSAPTATAR